ncbi:hypothetical protein ACFQX6_18740 [Streptosporangium lutulentum]
MIGLDDGTWVSVDGARGEVETGIGEEAATEIQRRAVADRRRSGTSRGPGRTSDDHPVKLLLNIGSAADLRATGSPYGRDAPADPAGEGRGDVASEGWGSSGRSSSSWTAGSRRATRSRSPPTRRSCGPPPAGTS